MTARYGLFKCSGDCPNLEQCDEACSMRCGDGWAEELQPLDVDELWPRCPCCGLEAKLVSVLDARAT
jgi:hypothetical protein